MRFRWISSTLTAFFAALPVLSQRTVLYVKQSASLKRTLLKKKKKEKLSRIPLRMNLYSCVCKLASSSPKKFVISHKCNISIHHISVKAVRNIIFFASTNCFHTSWQHVHIYNYMT